MKRIELLGPSGVGKTTLYNKICSVTEKKRSYLTLKDAYKVAAKFENVPFKRVDLWFYQLLLKTGLFNNRAQGLGKTILFGLKAADNYAQHNKYDPFSTSFKILLENMKGARHPYIAYKRIGSYVEKLEEYLLLERSLPEENFVLFDEGMLHKHPGITEFGILNFSPEVMQNDVALNPAGIVSCEQTADVIFKQALKRKKQGVYTFTQGSMTNKELREHVEQNVKHHKNKITRFKNYNIPVLHIDTREHADINMQKLSDFIHSLK